MNGNGVSGVRGDAIYHPSGVQISEIKKFTWNPKQATKDYSSNKTGGAKKRVSATKDGSGSLDGVWDPWDPITDHMEPGTEVILKLQHYTGQFWLVPAIIDDMSFTVDIESGDVQAWTANFSLNGPWTKPAVLAATTTTTTTTAGFLGDFDTAQALQPRRLAGNPSGVNRPNQPAGEPDRPEGWPAFADSAAPHPHRAEASAEAPRPDADVQRHSPHGPAAPALDEGTMHRVAEMVAKMIRGEPAAPQR